MGTLLFRLPNGYLNRLASDCCFITYVWLAPARSLREAGLPQRKFKLWQA
jgi:hypothetical protein